jgi:hypothetical protein
MSAMRHNMNTMMKHDGRGRPGSLRVTVGQSAADADIFYLFLLFLKYKYCMQFFDKRINWQYSTRYSTVPGTVLLYDT